MRVLVFHGYLLRGTGSNVYNARLCAALAERGHTVDLLSQDPRPEEQSFVDAVGTWEAGRPRVEVLREPVRVTAWRPDIGGLLTVYVADRYEGIQARTFLECRQTPFEVVHFSHQLTIALPLLHIRRRLSLHSRRKARNLA